MTQNDQFLLIDILTTFLFVRYYFRLYDFVQDDTLAPEDKIASYLTWAKTLKSGAFDAKATLVPE